MSLNPEPLPFDLSSWDDTLVGRGDEVEELEEAEIDDDERTEDVEPVPVGRDFVCALVDDGTSEAL